MQSPRHHPDYVLLFTVLILAAVGVVTIFSASSYLALHNTVHGQPAPLPPDFFAVRQLIAAVIGLILFVGLMRLHHWLWYRWAPPLLGITMLALVVVLAVGHSEYGGRRWIGSGAFHIQPSEIAIVATVLYLSFLFTKKVTMLHDARRTLRPAGIVVGLNFLLIIAEPDMGTAMTLVSTALTVMFASGVRLKPLVIAAIGAIPLLIGVALLEPYRVSRITAFLHPFQHAGDQAYQLLQGMTAIAEGGLFGRGFGMSIEKLGYLPVPQADFIFPVFVEEWGIVGALALLALFGVVIWRGFSIARHASDRFGALLAVGLTSMITIKTLINLGAVTGLLPVTGIPLPFISYGGTSLIVNMAAMGILLSVSCTTLGVEPEADRLAEVVAVEEVLARRRSDKADAPVQPSRPAAVTPIRTAQRRSWSTGRGTWRARQETAAGRSTGRSQRTRDDRSRTGGTWRERNAPREPRQPRPDGGNGKRGLFRKDR